MAPAVVAMSAQGLSEKDFVVHLNPIWRERANFIIDANIVEPKSSRRYEQLWARKVEEGRFEICCIPFFAYDLALGDEVLTRREGERLNVVDRVASSSGRFTFRVWFGNSSSAMVRDEVVEHLRSGVLFERYSRNLLAVDVENPELAQAVADFLHMKQEQQQLIYETGRTK